MSSGAAHTPGERDLDAELEAERAATDHWRRIARQRSTEYAALRHRPAIRALLAVDWRLDAVRDRVLPQSEWLHALGERFVLSTSAFGRRRAHDPMGALSSIPAPEADERRIAVVIVGPQPARAAWPTRAHTETFAMESGDVAAIRRVIDSSTHELVAIVLGTCTPVDDTWLARLAAEIKDDIAAATPVLVHPWRPAFHATPHDARVREAGLSIDATADGALRLRAAAAGTSPDASGAVSEVTSASPACILVDRASYLEAGGLPPTRRLDVAVIGLCARLHELGKRIVVVPAAVLVDHRPVSSRRSLDHPIDPRSAAWREVVDRFGPTLLRATEPLDSGALRFVVTVAAPSAKVAARWGDFHLAEALAAALRRRGHRVTVQTADLAEDPAGRACDVRVVLRGLEPVRRSSGQGHVLWIISHPESVEDEELDAADLVLVASTRFAEHLTTRTSTPVETLMQATDPRRFYPRTPDPLHQRQLTVVAKTRDVLRPAVADALAVGLEPAIYGGGWRGLVDPRLVVADHVDNDQLPVVYSSAGVVLNDHWRTMKAWGFVSNRLYDVLACGTPVISDPVPGISDQFDDTVLEYHSREELRELVDVVLADPVSARERAGRGRATVLARHTFDHRADELLVALQRRLDLGGPER